MRKFFLENLGLKTAAILLSVVLWIFVTSRGQSEISVDAPVEFKNIPTGFEVVNHGVKVISLNIKGQERLIKNVKPSDIRVYIDLSKSKKGESIYYLTRDDIKLPHAITVMNISPSSIKVITKETITKTVKVMPVITGDPESGYYVKSIEAVPQTVVIEGIRSEVGKVNNIRTEPLDITGVNETLTQDLKLELTGKNIRARMNDIKVKVVIGAGRK
ncbi:MAG: CdaR family protein [Nitrospirota bacterium]|nr:CdaR family protein [Nitrospirota bacterium]